MGFGSGSTTKEPAALSECSNFKKLFTRQVQTPDAQVASGVLLWTLEGPAWTQLPPWPPKTDFNKVAAGGRELQVHLISAI